ncbi:hypothetical protein HK096_003580, partial [Nowakowskiella sp. JEL0078]
QPTTRFFLITCDIFILLFQLLRAAIIHDSTSYLTSPRPITPNPRTTLRQRRAAALLQSLRARIASRIPQPVASSTPFSLLRSIRRAPRPPTVVSGRSSHRRNSSGSENGDVPNPFAFPPAAAALWAATTDSVLGLGESREVIARRAPRRRGALDGIDVNDGDGLDVSRENDRNEYDDLLIDRIDRVVGQPGPDEGGVAPDNLPEDAANVTELGGDDSSDIVDNLATVQTLKVDIVYLVQSTIVEDFKRMTSSSVNSGQISSGTGSGLVTTRTLAEFVERLNSLNFSRNNSRNLPV